MMDREELERAATYWERKDAERDPSLVMPADELRRELDSFLSERNTCALACASGDLVRNTPVEYVWADGCFWIFSEGGLKFRALAGNDHVCVAVFDAYDGFGRLAGAQVTGEAEVLDPASPGFTHALELRGIPAERAERVASMLHVIRVRPTQADLLLSSLKGRGYDSRQHLDCR